MIDPRRALVHGLVRLSVARDGPSVTAADARRKAQRRLLRPQPYAPPTTREMRGVALSVEHSRGWPVYTARPEGDASDGAPPRAVFLHGGAYIGEIGPYHWAFVAHLVRRARVAVAVPVQPLAPRWTAATTVPAVADLVAEVLDGAGPAGVTLVGDSAGAGLALAAARHLRDAGGPRPRRLVLVAPWVDVTMTHPDQPALEPGDLMLNRGYLAEAGRLYAGDLDVRDPQVSPLQGDLRGLPPLTVLVGADDLLLPDARRLHDAARAAGVDVDLVVAPGMQHDYPLFPLLPEAKAARAQLVGLLQRGLDLE